MILLRGISVTERIDEPVGTACDSNKPGCRWLKADGVLTQAYKS